MIETSVLEREFDAKENQEAETLLNKLESKIVENLFNYTIQLFLNEVVTEESKHS